MSAPRYHETVMQRINRERKEKEKKVARKRMFNNAIPITLLVVIVVFITLSLPRAFDQWYEEPYIVDSTPTEISDKLIE